jgi:hypothetical protein
MKRGEPNYLNGVIISDGAKKHDIECDNEQVYSYWTPDNICIERGASSF